ncbi:hypothetical protein PROFUN_02408 [Planoprotostelium fungivorum]|uniref:Uncharacterized protein n=1 Tax=Planoprotostelium fungivorum TaxID=1890364 RepID=A0A2P6NV14_9EUKA|nr:hypothetical protein PROFUN_02408 [Planoprotostelium fungivorum]
MIFAFADSSHVTSLFRNTPSSCSAMKPKLSLLASILEFFYFWGTTVRYYRHNREKDNFHVQCFDRDNGKHDLIRQVFISRTEVATVQESIATNHHNSMPSFENKRIVFISGGGRGLALQAVKILLTEERDQIVIAGVRSVEASKRAIQELVPSIAEGNLLEVVAFDLTDKASIEKAAQHVESTYGRLDVLISSAAIATSDARTIFATNIYGTAIADEAFIPLLEKSRDAHLVEVTSGLASLCLGAVPPQTKEKFDRDDISHDEFEQLVQDYYNAAEKNDYATLYGDAHAKFYGDYGMSKMFLNVYARALAQKIKSKEKSEILKGISLSLVCPGYCATDLTYHQGPRSAEDGARSILTSTRVPISQTGQAWTYGHHLPFSVTTVEYDELVAKC